jgi:methionyl-tRNA formyltransferase
MDIQDKAAEHILSSSERLLSDIYKSSLKLLNQPNYPYFYFPSLTESSGELFPTEINCKMALQIIKSCSRPFPGAFILNQGQKFRIWKAKIIQHSDTELNLNKNSIIINEKLYVRFLDRFLCSSDFEVE